MDDNRFALYDYRVRVAELYRFRDRELDEGDDPAEVCSTFRKARDELFQNHSESALAAEQKSRFRGLNYFPYLDSGVVDATVDVNVNRERVRVELTDEDVVVLETVALLYFEFAGDPVCLTLFWVDSYGGGLFLPFRDSTSGQLSYGGGRYLFDTVKGSTFRSSSGDGNRRKIALDFNYAYNPSCAYNYRWSCPLAPRTNHLSLPVPAGEKNYTS